MTISRETALLSLQSIQSGSLTDLATVMRALINGDLTEEDITSFLEVESLSNSELVFREDGVGRVMSWVEFIEAITVELGNNAPAGPGTYFFDAVGGDDTNNGRSSATAFQSIQRFNSKNFLPGDVCSFKRGQSHSGGMVLPSSGTSAAPIIINAYGVGYDPIISSGALPGFTALNKSYFTLDSLNFIGGREPNNEVDDLIPNLGDGILIQNDEAGDTKLGGIRLRNLIVSHYGSNGVLLTGLTAAAGFASPLIDNVQVFGCTHNNETGARQAGIRVSSDVNFGAATNDYSHTNVTIRGCSVHDNTGTPTDIDWNGAGIYVAQTDGALLIGNVVFGNGLLSTFPTAAPFGIWTVDSTAVIIQENESYLNRVASGIFDGGGICIGTGCTACIAERNYTHGNHGSGIKLYAGPEADIFAWDGNIVRFNVSEDDHTRAFELGGSIAVHAAANMINVKVHNNTIYQRGGSPRNGLMLFSSTGATIDDYEGYIANNIIFTTSTAALLQADGMNTVYMRLRGNNYYSSGTFLIEWNGTDYFSYAAWQAVASTQEKISAVNVGLTLNPLFTSPGTDGVINANNALLVGYKLQADSPMISAGLDLQSEFSFSPGTLDFHSNLIAAPFEVGSSSSSQQAVLTIAGTPVVTALQGSAYGGFTVVASGGTGAKTYALLGTWPTGLSVHASTGVVSGTPTQTGAFAGLSIRATDTLSVFVDLTPFTLTIASNIPTFTIPPVITPDSIFGGYAGSVWTCTPANWSAGTPTHQWYADGIAIGGATAATYTMTIANEGKAITCRETISGVVAISNSIELWVPADTITASPVAIMDIRQGLTGSPSVSAWASQIGGISASQATGAAQPQYSATSLGGKPGLTYDIGDSLAGLAISIAPTARTVIGVAQWTTSSVSHDIIRTSANGGYTLRRNINNGGLDVVSTNVAIRAQSAGAMLPSLAPRVFASRLTASGPFNFQGGGVDSNSGTASGGFSGTGTEIIGSTMTGILGSILIYDAYLTDDEVARATGWIAWTTGQAAALNSAAVYKNAAPLAVTALPTAIATTVPEGTDNEAIIATIPTSLTNATYTITAGGEGMSVINGDVVISDTAAFFAAEPSASIRVSKAGSADQLFNLNCTIVPGYYDIGKFGNNVGMWWDFADQGTFSPEENESYIRIIKDKSNYGRHMENPWFPEKRQRIASPSTLKPTVKAMRNITWSLAALFGVANVAAPIWHGFRYLQMTATSISLGAANSTSNNTKTVFSGIPSMIGKNLMVLIIADETQCILRVNGVQIGSPKLVGAGYFPPLNPCILGFAVRIINFSTLNQGQILAVNHLGQHPYWEGGSFNGDLVEVFQLFNVRAG